jgi:hypothetical protein
MKYLKLFEAFTSQNKISFTNNLLLEFLIFKNLEENAYITPGHNDDLIIQWTENSKSFAIFLVEYTNSRVPNFPLGGRALVDDGMLIRAGKFLVYQSRETIIRKIMPFMDRDFVSGRLHNMHGDNPIWKAIQKFIRLYEEKENSNK